MTIFWPSPDIFFLNLKISNKQYIIFGREALSLFAYFRVITLCVYATGSRPPPLEKRKMLSMFAHEMKIRGRLA